MKEVSPLVTPIIIVVLQLTLACWVIFHLLTFFMINFFQKFVLGYYQSVNQVRSRSGPTFCRFSPDLGPNCLQRLSADNKSLLARKELIINLTYIL